MQYKLSALLTTLLVAASYAGAATVKITNGAVLTDEQLDDWIAKTDNLTFIGGSGDGTYSKRRAGVIRNVLCNHVVNHECTECITVIETNKAECVTTPISACIASTNPAVTFYDAISCGGHSSTVGSCQTKLKNNYCAFPKIKSFRAPAP